MTYNRILSTCTLAVGLFLSVATCHASNPQLDKAWSELSSNNYKSALELFSAASSSGDAHADWGKMWVGWVNDNDSLAWSAFKSGISKSTYRDPYMFAMMSTTMFNYAGRFDREGLEKLYLDFVKTPDSLGILKAMAYENLGYVYRRANKLDLSQEMFNHMGAITQWRLLGPFDNISASGYDTPYPPERSDDSPEATYTGESGRLVKSIDLKAVRPDCWIDMDLYYPTSSGTFYATSYMYVPRTQRMQMRLGTSGSCKLFVDSLLVLSNIEEYNNDLDTYIAEVELTEGWHKLLVKVGSSEIHRCNFLLRATDASGNTMQGIKYTTIPQVTAASPTAAREIANPFLQYFDNAILRDPSNIDNYLFLAQGHLRNDNAEKAEDALLVAAAKTPNSILALRMLGEAYYRGTKRDEYASTIEHIKTLRPDIPYTLVYSFYLDLGADRLDEAEAKLAQIALTIPNTETYFDAAMAVANARNRIQDKLELQTRAYMKYPDNVSYMSNAAGLAMQSPGRHKSATAIIKAYLEQEYNDRALSMLAGISLDQGDMQAWRRYMDDILLLHPASPGYYRNISAVYAERKQFDSAITNIRRAIDIAPSVGAYWYTLGTLEMATGEKERAKESYTTALQYDASDFNSRDALRDLNGTPHPFTALPSPNIDSIYSTAPTARQFPEDDAIVLYDDMRRVVYDGSICDVLRESVYRVFTKEGIDALKEFATAGAGDGEFIVDKAIVRKPNGKEIPADHQSGYFVFKSLEIGDFIYMKTRTREARSGRLAKAFFDNYGFNAYYPVQYCRYALLTNDTTAFQYTVSNSTIDPTSSTTSFGNLTIWESRNLPAILPEAGMPDYEVIGQRLQVTSVKSWREIVDWYHAIARTKTKSSREIRAVMDSLCPVTEKLGVFETIARVYSYITSEIRYSNVPFRQSGIVPQKARKVLVTRIGDCKDVATLCIAMLAERDIKAFHVLVETNTSVLIPKRLPCIPFDHAIVGSYIQDTMRFFDLTADNVPIGSIPFADVEAFALPINESTSYPYRLSKHIFTPNNITVSTNINIDSIGDAHIQQKVIHTGARTQLVRAAWKEMTETELRKDLAESLSEQYGDVTIEDIQMNHLNDLSPQLDYTLTFSVPAYVVDAGEFRIARIPWRDAFYPDAALSYTKRMYPIEMDYSRDTVLEHIVVNIPRGYEAMGLQPKFERTGPVMNVSMSAHAKNNSIEVTRKSVRMKSYVDVDEYDAYRTFYNDVRKEDRKGILFAPAGTVVATPGKSKQPKRKN